MGQVGVRGREKMKQGHHNRKIPKEKSRQILSRGPEDHDLDLLLMFNQVLRAKHLKKILKIHMTDKGPGDGGGRRCLDGLFFDVPL